MLNDNYVVLFCIYFYVLVLSMIWATIKDAVGLWHYDRFRPLASSLTNVVLNIILVRFIGLYGVIISTIISYTFVAMPWALINIFKYVYKRDMREYLKKLAYYIIICILICIVVEFLSYFVKVNGIMGLLIKATIAIVLSNFIQIIVYKNSIEYKESKQLIKKMLKIGG